MVARRDRGEGGRSGRRRHGRRRRDDEAQQQRDFELRAAQVDLSDALFVGSPEALAMSKQLVADTAGAASN